MYTIFESAVNLFESCAAVHFICAVFRHNFRTVKGKVVFLIGVAADFVCVSIMNRYIAYEGILGTIYVLIYWAYAILFLKGPALKKLFTAFVTVLVMLCVSSWVSSLVTVISDRELISLYKQETVERICSVVTTQILILIVYDLMLKYMSSLTLKMREWHLALLVLAVSFTVAASIHITLINSDIEARYAKMLMVAEIGIICLNIASFYMTYELSLSNAETEELRSQEQLKEYRAQYAEGIKLQYAETRRMKHDMKQNLEVIAALCRSGKTEEALSYADRVSDKLKKTDSIIDAGNDFISAILNSKLSAAKAYGIDTLCTVRSDINGAEDIDLCTLLGNMLDNAIEAARECAGGFIEVSLSADENKIIAVTANSIQKSVLKSNHDLISSKPDRKAHGYGIKTIRSIAEKYNGTVNFYEEGNTFFCQAVMYKTDVSEDDTSILPNLPK